MTKSSTLTLYDIAHENGVSVDNFPMIYNASMSYCADDGKCHIGVDERQLKNTIDEKEKLAHELGHCIQGAFYNKFSPLDIVGRHEYRANRWKVEELLPFYRLNAALMLGMVEYWQLSEFFELSLDCITMAIDVYTRQGKLTVY